MLSEKPNFLPNCEIAVVGMAGLFPEASDIKAFWNNILSKKNCISEIGNDWQGYWRPEDYYDPNPKAPDKVYSKKAGLIPEIDFDLLEFNIPPMNLEATSQDQLYSLFAAKKAFQDSGLLEYSDKSRIGVILGVAEVGNIGFYLATRTDYQNWRRVLENFDLPKEMISAIVERMKNLYPQWQENSLPGFLGNVVCGRITHHFNLGGPNYSVSAACASSLAAIKAAINELTDGTCDAVLTGGVNIDTNSAFAFSSFTKTPVISVTEHIRPYDQDSNGIMLGDAVGMIVLKRLKDAERDGDKIYGVIKSVGATSDGKGDSIYAPKVEGQIRTLEQAYEKSGCSFETIGLVEGHGTGTVAGDFCEFQALNTIFKDVPKQTIALGSVKSQIGHTRIAAGAASMIKALIALDNKILPPTINVSTPNSKFQIENSAFYLNTEARPWIHSERKGPRRAAVSSFGFGGTNFHVVLEEYVKTERFIRFGAVPDILLIQASTPEKLLEKCQKLLAYFKTDLAVQYYQDYLNSIKNIQLNSQWPRIGFVALSINESCELLEQSITLISSQPNQSWEHPKGIYYRLMSLDLEKKRVVALFPGQGSQYVNMASKLVQNYPEARKVFEHLDDIAEEKRTVKLSSIIFPPPCFDDRIRSTQKAELTKTQHAQPAICAVNMGFYKLLHKAGFQADFIIGHSLGELTALWAADALNDADLLQLTLEQGKAMAPKNSAPYDKSGMLAIMANEKAVADILPMWPDLQIANYDAPNQIVVGGSLASIQLLDKELNEQGVKTVLLPVSAAFHTSFVAHAEDSFQKSLLKTSFRPLNQVVYSNVTSEPYSPSISSADIQKTLAKQITNPVLFQQSIEKIYREGGYLFVEIGPKNTLSNLVKDILKGKDHECIAVNPDPEKDSELQFRQAVVQLMVAGVAMKDLDPYQMETKTEKTTLRKNFAVKLNGGFYLNAPGLKLRKEALEEKSNLSFKNFLTQKESTTVNLQDNTIATSLNSEQYLHKNQAAYLSLMEQLIQNQKIVIEKLNQHPDFVKILDSLSQTQKLLEKSQAEYRNNRYSSNEMLSTNHVALQQHNLENPKNVAQSGIDTQHLVQRIKQLIAQRVGCSVDKLDLNADLELGLGLDLFKVLEVSAVIHDEFSISREVLDNLFELPTLNEMINFISSKFGEFSTAQITPLFAAAHCAENPIKNNSEPKQAAAVDPAKVKEVTEKILQIVSQETGYPTDVLEVNMDLSAELGVDSIKMVQILGSVQTQYPELETAEGGEAEDLGKLRTIEQIAQHVSQILLSTSSAMSNNAAAANDQELGIFLSNNQAEELDKKKELA